MSKGERINTDEPALREIFSCPQSRLDLQEASFENFASRSNIVVVTLVVMIAANPCLSNQIKYGVVCTGRVLHSSSIPLGRLGGPSEHLLGEDTQDDEMRQGLMKLLTAF